MKFLNFGKVKKAVKSFFNSLAFWNEKKYRKEAATLEKLGEETRERYLRRKGGWEYYRYICKPLNKRFKPIYRDFKKHKLPGSLIIIGKVVFRIEKNPRYKYA